MLKNYIKVKVDEDGTKRYFNEKGERHRLDGPAVEWSDGTKIWRINGNCHRNIDPSDEWSDGEKLWWFNSGQHRVGGSYSSHDDYWYIHGKEYTKKEYFDKVWDI